jgi:hypothetical protein
MGNNLALLPPVKRARGYRLYTESARFVDLYLDGGRAVLGHNAPGILREMKNVAERSLFAPYPSYWTRRFEKALSLLFPEKSFTVYGSMEALPSVIREQTPVWRPYMKWGGGDALAVLPHSLAPVALVSRPQSDDTSVPSHIQGLSPVILALTTQAIYNVLRCPERGTTVPGRVDEALADGPWTRTGIYARLKERATDEDWTRIFRRFLDAGFLIPPTQRDPLIVPGELSPGEEKALAECLRDPV